MPHPSNGRVEHDLLFRRTRYDYGWMVAWIPLVAAKMNEGRMHSNLHFFLKCEVRVGNNVITAKFHCKIFALFRKIDRNWKVEGERIVLLFEWYMKQLLRVPSFEMYRNVPLNWKCEGNATQRNSKQTVRSIDDISTLRRIHRWVSFWLRALWMYACVCIIYVTRCRFLSTHMFHSMVFFLSFFRVPHSKSVHTTMKFIVYKFQTHNRFFVLFIKSDECVMCQQILLESNILFMNWISRIENIHRTVWMEK